MHPLNSILALSDHFILTINKSPNATDIASVMKAYTVHIKKYLVSVEKLEKEFSALKVVSKKKDDDKVAEPSSSGGRLSLSLPSKVILNSSKDLRVKCTTSLGIILKLLKIAFGDENQFPLAETIRQIEMLIHDVGILLWRISQAKTLFLIALERFTVATVGDAYQEEIIKSAEEANFQAQHITSPSIKKKDDVHMICDEEETSSTPPLSALDLDSSSTDAILKPKSDKFDCIKVQGIFVDF